MEEGARGSYNTHMKVYPKRIPAIHILLVQDNQVLMLKRANTGYEDGNYSIPAGHIENQESVLSAAKRELYEETGLTIGDQELEFVHVMDRKNPDDKQERIDFFFLCRDWLGEPVNKEPEKCESLDWFRLDKLPDNTIPYVKQAIDLIRKNIEFSSLGREDITVGPSKANLI